MPDGGVVHLRHLNPLVTNPYFNILNVKEIRKRISSFDIKEYSTHKDSYMDNYPTHILKGAYEFVYYEPYYPFFVWMSQNFKTLYLNAENHPDGLSSILHDHNNQPFLIHTWFSRLYNIDKKQTKRINSAFHECELSSGNIYKTSLKEFIYSFIQLNLIQIKSCLVRIKKSVLK